MNVPGPLLSAVFVRRDNRFRATVRLDDVEVAAHVPNSGRLHELFVPGRQVLVRPAKNPRRKTSYDLLMVWVDDVLVSLDSRLPNALFAEAVQEGRLPQFRAYRRVRREVRLGRSRIDLLLEGEAGRCWVETKSVTLVERGTALFPDAITARGKRHVEELAMVLGQGACAAIVFVVQRPDALRFRPHEEADPAFAHALRRAATRGVRVYAYRCRVHPGVIQLAEAIPVCL